MKHLLLCLSLVIVLLLAIPAAASPLDDKMAVLKKAIKEEIAAKSNASPNTFQSPAYANVGNVLASLDQVAAQIDNPNMGNNAEVQISQLLSAFSSEAVQKAGQALLAEIHSERKARADATATEIQALLKRVSEVVAAAKKPEDLDEIIIDLQKFQNGRSGSYAMETQALYQQVSMAFEFTKLWQNYLSHLATGQDQLATNDLQNLSQNNFAVGIMPRSQILALQAGLNNPGKSGATPSTPPPSAAETIIKGIKTLDEMEPALKQLEPMRQNDGKARIAYDNLNRFVQIYLDLKAGLAVNLDIDFGAYAEQPNIGAALQAQLQVFLLQQYFDTYKGTPPTPDEKPQAFVNRVITDAVSHENWPLLLKALTGQAYLNQKSSFGRFGVQYASLGADDLRVALNREMAGQYALAVVSYQSALAIPDTAIPAKLIGERLTAIQKDHPKEYEAGMQMTISPPPSAPQPMLRNYPGMPGRLVNPTTQPEPVPSIPAANTNQTATPAPPTAVPASTNQPPAKPVPPATNAASPVIPVPSVTVISGDGQEGAPGTLASQPLVVSVTAHDGIAVADAPVTFKSKYGGLSATNSFSIKKTVTVSTDASGLAQVYITFPDQKNTQNPITATLNSSYVIVKNYSNDSFPTDPSDMKSVFNQDGSVDVTWENHNNKPIPISIEMPDGHWKLVGTAPAGTTSYHIPPQ